MVPPAGKKAGSSAGRHDPIGPRPQRSALPGASIGSATSAARTALPARSTDEGGPPRPASPRQPFDATAGREPAYVSALADRCHETPRQAAERLLRERLPDGGTAADRLRLLVAQDWHRPSDARLGVPALIKIAGAQGSRPDQIVAGTQVMLRKAQEGVWPDGTPFGPAVLAAVRYLADNPLVTGTERQHVALIVQGRTMPYDERVSTADRIKLLGASQAMLQRVHRQVAAEPAYLEPIVVGEKTPQQAEAVARVFVDELGVYVKTQVIDELLRRDLRLGAAHPHHLGDERIFEIGNTLEPSTATRAPRGKTGGPAAPAMPSRATTVPAARQADAGAPNVTVTVATAVQPWQPSRTHAIANWAAATGLDIREHDLIEISFGGPPVTFIVRRERPPGQALREHDVALDPLRARPSA